MGLTVAQRKAKREADQRYQDRVGRQKHRDKAQMRRRWLALLKLAYGCIDCGYREDHRALEFDHRADKLHAVTHLVSCSAQRLFAEIAKCDIRCANCHAIVTAERRGITS